MKTKILFISLCMATFAMAQTSDDSQFQEPNRGGDFFCSGVVISGSSATVTLCASDYNPIVALQEHPTSFNVVLPSGLQYGVSGTLALLNTSYTDSLVIREVDASGNTLAKLAKLTHADNGAINIPAQSTTGRFVFDIYCYNMGTGTSAGFSLTISPLEQTELEFACATYMGVGTCSPQKTLHVNGDLRITNPQYTSSYLDVQTGYNSVLFNSNNKPFYFNNKVISTDGFYSAGNTNLTLGTGNNSRVTILNDNGNVGIGTTNPAYKLDVVGEIRSDSIRTQAINVQAVSGADFVFDKDYDLPTLEAVKAFIQANRHLPEIQSAEDMQANGVNISDFQIQLLQKIEELTLYIIKQDERIKELESAFK